jgi:NAD(P)-dependent dehydrogenase (short-subunit alcohol dehydrogenase family)
MVQRNKNPAKIICISSDASTHPMRGSTLYCSSKAALDHAVRCAARELSPDGWVINAINPGKIDDTKMTEYIDSTVPGFRKWTPEEAYEREASQIPMGRRGTKEEIANLVYSILTTDCDYMNGSIIAVNGAR